jgi:phytoene desaturase
VVRLGDAVTAIHTLGDRVTGVHRKRLRAEVDAVASNADIVHSYRESAQGFAQRPAHRGPARAEALLAVAVRRPFRGARHLPRDPAPFDPVRPALQGLLEDIYDHGVLSEDFSLYLHHPERDRSGMAPEGHSTFYALAPVPHLGKFPADWDEVGPVLEERILAEIARRLIPDLKDRIVTKFSYAPPDFATI